MYNLIVKVKKKKKNYFLINVKSDVLNLTVCLLSGKVKEREFGFKMVSFAIEIYVWCVF